MADLSSQSRKVVKKAEGIGLAQVTFRVRCEKIGHGESVFLSQADDPAAGNQVREELDRQSSLNQFSHFFFIFGIILGSSLHHCQVLPMVHNSHSPFTGHPNNNTVL